LSAPPRLWRGSPLVAGWLVETAWLGEAEARRRVLILAGDGPAFAVDGGYLVRLASPRRVRGPWLATPLVADGKGLVAAAGLRASSAEAVVLRGGAPVVLALDRPVDRAGWLDLSGWSTVAVRSLGAPVQAAGAVLAAIETDGRKLLHVRPADPDAASLGTALDRPRPLVAAGLGLLVGAVVAGVGLLQKARAALPEGATASGSGGPGWLDRLEAAASRFLLAAGLGSLLGERYASYYRELLDLLDTDVDAALRRAIPLGNGAGGSAAAGNALRLPGWRMGPLGPTLGQLSPASRVVPSPDDLYSFLREKYRQLAARLERDGRIEEAAFVWADLLGDAPAAVALLERHERFDLAAALAEGRELAPGLVVRLWFLAGDVPRAVAVARRTGAFADAVVRLKDRPEVQRRLAGYWAVSLARTGRYHAAIGVIREYGVPADTDAWWAAAVAVGGADAARLVVERLATGPWDGWEAHAAAILAAGPATRHALIEVLVGVSPTPEIRWVAERAARAMLPAVDRGEVPRIALERVAQLGSRFLLADLPPSRGLPARADFGVVAGTGVRSATSAVRCPDGGWLAALGEAGVARLTPDGRMRMRWEYPATRLIPDDTGTRAIAVHPDGDAHRVGLLDLASGEWRDWGWVDLRAWSSWFDRDLWFVADHGALLAIDVTAPRWSALWRLSVEVGAVEAGPQGFAAEVDSDGRGPNVWLWERPRIVLRHRQEIALPADGEGVLHGVHPFADGWVTHARRADGTGVVTVFRPGVRAVVSEVPSRDAAVAVVGAWLVAVQPDPEGLIVHRTPVASPGTWSFVRLDGANSVAVTPDGPGIVLADDRGRLVAWGAGLESVVLGAGV
jgi:hypothetical protein